MIGVAACADDEDGEPPVSKATSELAITLDADGPGGAAPREVSVDCSGSDAPPKACDAIARLPEDPAAAIPPATACTEIYGGPDVVTIEGTVNGEAIDAELTRANGCEIDRFDRFTSLLRAVFPAYRPGAGLAP